MKTWILRSTGEVRPPICGEWYVTPYNYPDDPPKQCNNNKEIISYHILSIEILDHDPMEPIKKIWDIWLKYHTWNSHDAMEAIKKAVEGK